MPGLHLSRKGGGGGANGKVDLSKRNNDNR